MLTFLTFQKEKYCLFHLIVLCLSVLSFSKVSATTYYVNDGSTKGDIYTTTIGDDKHDGLTPNSPKRTLTNVYLTAQVGDIIYVDTGTYPEIRNGVVLLNNLKNIRFIIAGKSDEIYHRKPLPENEKVAPEVFYIINDKPVDREVYRQQSHVDTKKE